MKFIISFFIIILFIKPLYADDASIWLKTEIDTILGAYKNTSIQKSEKFEIIENTINNNFAGAGIAKFVAGKSWGSANKDTKKEFIKLFKRHLALNIASMMQGYSNQTYKLIDSKYDKQNKVSLIDMEIYFETNKLLITWRIKKSKDRFFVIDLIVADISLVITKRSEFNSMLKKVNNNLKDFNILLERQNKASYNRLMG